MYLIRIFDCGNMRNVSVWQEECWWHRACARLNLKMLTDKNVFDQNFFTLFSIVATCEMFQYGMKSVGGIEHVPPGWDEWHGLVRHFAIHTYLVTYLLAYSFTYAWFPALHFRSSISIFITVSVILVCTTLL